MRTLYRNFRWWESGEPQMMLVEEGRVVDRGSSIHAEGEVVDLGGDFLMPKFVDSHCHILPAGLDLQKLYLGGAESHAEVLDLVAMRHREQQDGWLMAVHYDQTKYEGGRHLTRGDLDAISSERAILLRHSNGHASIANSAALRAAGVNRETADPPGGSFGRDAHGELDGTLFEAAHELVTQAAPSVGTDEMTDAIGRAAESMAAFGIGCASDMMTGRYDLMRELEAYEAASRTSPIEMRLYVQWRDVFGGRATPLPDLRDRFNDLETRTSGRIKVAGVKIFADGAIGSATAAIYGRYSGEAPHGATISLRAQDATHAEREVSGQLIYSPDRLGSMIRTASDAGFQVCVHSIGDYSSDLVMDAFESTGEPWRHRLEHGMILSDAQIERLEHLGCFLSFQPEFLKRFGHSYLRQLGPERMARLKRARSVLDAGIRLSFSSDRPIVAGDPMDGIQTAVHRPSGFDPSENCTVEEAIRAYTVEGHRVNGDADGELTKGQRADFRTVTENPVSLLRK